MEELAAATIIISLRRKAIINNKNDEYKTRNNCGAKYDYFNDVAMVNKY